MTRYCESTSFTVTRKPAFGQVDIAFHCDEHNEPVLISLDEEILQRKLDEATGRDRDLKLNSNIMNIQTAVLGAMTIILLVVTFS